MARKLIDQEEAAKILGVSAEEIGSLRDRKKLFPYRDGAEWKYKQEDIEKLRDEMQGDNASDSNVASASWATSSALDDIELEVNEGIDSILLSEIELGKSGKEGPSTIIGKPSGKPGEEADVLPTEPKKPASSSSDLTLASSDIGLGSVTVGGQSGGSALGGTTGSVTTGSGLGGGSALGSGTGSDVRLVVGGSDAAKAAGSSGKIAGGSDKMFGSDALSLSDEELSLIGSDVASAAVPEPDDAGSSIKLEDDDAVLGGSSSSDVTQSPTDSGIQLISASDSGLSLDAPLAMSGSAKEMLDLEDSDVAPLADDADLAAAPEEKGDEEFLLTALDDSLAEESDSGSQVIALDADDEMSSGMFAPVAGGAAMLEEEPAMDSGAGAPMISASVGGPATAPAFTTMAPTVGEAGFSTPNVVVLVICSVLLLLVGMMAYDLMRNMWSWDGPYSLNSSIMDSIGSTIGWFEK